ncbi:hypothetical protein STCU_10585 [Strigomonas culicis]|uniref:Uncharacterized protein n=1 Tax=Strigomonas culicis TaxID=28005 RepID=S9THF8_9TRYP|nr:hypothetical protein STCU_10585 [Strigomonas culicis]|eukprot:EPY17487.1 hypothetical protein STCU_10585 [Strigomonas culicis]
MGGGGTLLHYAVHHVLYTLTKMLLDFYFDFNATNDDNETPLFTVVKDYLYAQRQRQQQEEEEEEEEEAPAAIAVSRAALLRQRQQIRLHIIELLLRSGADVAQQSASQLQSAVHLVAEGGDAKLLRLFFFPLQTAATNLHAQNLIQNVSFVHPSSFVLGSAPAAADGGRSPLALGPAPEEGGVSSALRRMRERQGQRQERAAAESPDPLDHKSTFDIVGPINEKSKYDVDHLLYAEVKSGGASNVGGFPSAAPFDAMGLLEPHATESFWRHINNKGETPFHALCAPAAGDDDAAAPTAVKAQKQRDNLFVMQQLYHHLSTRSESSLSTPRRAANHDHAATIQWPALLTTMDADGRTPLFHAVRSGFTEAVVDMIAHVRRAQERSQPSRLQLLFLHIDADGRNVLHEWVTACAQQLLPPGAAHRPRPPPPPAADAAATLHALSDLLRILVAEVKEAVRLVAKRRAQQIYHLDGMLPSLSLGHPSSTAETVAQSSITSLLRQRKTGTPHAASGWREVLFGQSDVDGRTPFLLAAALGVAEAAQMMTAVLREK